MKSLAILLVVAALAATTATAQVTMPIPPGVPRTNEQPLRVTSTFRTIVALTPTQMVPDAAAQETARRALYAMAADECAALSEIFKSDCRLISVQVVAYPPLGSNAQPANVLNATATYELRPLHQPPAR